MAIQETVLDETHVSSHVDGTEMVRGYRLDLESQVVFGFGRVGTLRLARRIGLLGTLKLGVFLQDLLASFADRRSRSLQVLLGCHIRVAGSLKEIRRGAVVVFGLEATMLVLG